MRNLINAELFKIKKSRAVKVTGILALCYLLLGQIINLVVYLIASDQSKELAKQNNAAINSLGVLNGTYSLMLLILFGVLASAFVVGEFRNGTIRNYFISGSSRLKIFLTKYINAMISAVALVVVIFLLNFLLNLIFYGMGEGVTAKQFFEMIGFMFLIAFASMALSSFIYFIAFSLKNTAATIGLTIGVYFVVNIISSIPTLVAMATNRVEVGPNGFALSEGTQLLTNILSSLWVGNAFDYFTPGTEAKYLAMPIIMCFVYLFGSAVGGALMFTKRDIK